MTFCERTEHSKASFDRRSFRWLRRGSAKILIGCPRGKWNARTERCKVGTRAYKVLSRPGATSCPTGSKRIKK